MSQTSSAVARFWTFTLGVGEAATTLTSAAKAAVKRNFIVSIQAGDCCKEELVMVIQNEVKDMKVVVVEIIYTILPYQALSLHNSSN